MSQPFRGQGGDFVFPVSTKNTYLVENVEVMLPVKLLNSVQRFQRSGHCSANQRPWRPSCFSDRSEKHKLGKLVEDIEILLPVKFRWIPFCGFRAEVENVSANQRPGRSSCFSDRPKKHKLGRGHRDLASCQVSSTSVQWFQSRSRMSQPIRGHDGHLVFSDRPEKHKLGRGHRDLASCQVSLNSDQRFQRSRKCLSQSETRVAILFFRSAPKHKFDRGCRVLVSCQVSLNSVQWFQRSRKCEKLTTGGRRTFGPGALKSRSLNKYSPNTKNVDVFFTSWMKSSIKCLSW